MDISSLQSYFKNQMGESSSFFDHAVCRFFEKGEKPPQDFLEDECVCREPAISEEKAIDNWKHLLRVNIFCELAGIRQAWLPEKVRALERQPWNQSSQYFRSLVALNHAFAKMPVPTVGPHLLESGAALIDLYEYTPWLSLPYTPQHYEFGIFLSILGLLTGRQELKETVLRLAKWQLNTLDMNAIPLQGLFAREKDSRTLQSFCISYLLFRTAAIFSVELPFLAIAEAALKSIDELVKLTNEEIDPLWPLLEVWLNQYPLGTSDPFSITEHVYDPSTALVGYRSSSQHAVCTLHGEKTGLGTLRKGDVEIISYGPQYLPLADCAGFGIEGNALSDQGMRRSIIEWRPNSFLLKGCARMVDQPSDSLFGFGHYRGIWLEVSQEFKRPHFYLKTTFLGLDGWDSVAFSFFVKAKQCSIDSQKSLFPQTLERYEEKSVPIVFEGEEGNLELNPLGFEGKMQVIPLSGGNNFWGADFLVSYHLSNEQHCYQWHIGPK